MCGVVCCVWCGVWAGRDIVTGHFGIKRQQKKTKQNSSEENQKYTQNKAT